MKLFEIFPLFKGVNLLLIIGFVSVLGFYSCEPTSNIDGIWFVDYVETNDSTKDYSIQKVLIEFNDSFINTIRFGDFSTGHYLNLEIDSHSFTIENSIIKSDGKELTLIYQGDSTISLSEKDSDYKMILKRINLRPKDFKVNSDCLKGSFVIQVKEDVDSLEFINDSILIHTGSFYENYPFDKWSILTYKGISFFVTESNMYPLLQITSCSSDSLRVKLNTLRDSFFKLKKLDVKSDKDQFIGDWIEIKDSTDIGFLDTDLLVSISRDSIRSINHIKREKLPWGLTNDGKRIYFIDKIGEDGSSWKIINITNNLFTFQVMDGASLKTIKLKKIRN